MTSPTIAKSTLTLLFIQSFSLACTPAIAGYYIIKTTSWNKLSVGLFVSIFLSPIIFLANIANFHPEVVALPFMLVAIFESQKKRQLML